MTDYSYRLRAYTQVQWRLDELRAEARQEVLARRLRRPRRLRRRLGMWLIALGERLAGGNVRAAFAEAEAAPAGG